VGAAGQPAGDALARDRGLTPSLERRAIVVTGAVQGVGFRPYVYALACRFGLTGFVLNRTGQVVIEAEGAPALLDEFVTELARQPPRLAWIDQVRCESRDVAGDRSFRIEASERGSGAEVVLPPDVATCDDCLRELFDPTDRRHRYPFLNCTSCGPRLTIIQGVPYDRARTAMSGFTLCHACRAEYEDPLDRRFHAQPIACPACGPRASLLDGRGAVVACDDPLATAAQALARGAIVAMKGLGGYHLACDAANEDAVAALRRRKHRDAKPFALMVEGSADAVWWCDVASDERAALESPARPIVLLRQRAMEPGARAIARSVAPEQSGTLGVMLAYTPLHHLLLRDVGAAQAGGRAVLVMTSGNRADEPIAFEDHDALERLRGIADYFVTHDRRIETRCDDSVERFAGGRSAGRVLLRRSRGYAPLPMRLPQPVSVPTLAVGGDLKAAFAIAATAGAVVSHHLGDLAHHAAYEAFERAVAHYERVYGVTPERIAHDLHPDYATTRYALERATRGGVTLLAVQHHHAHMASCMAERGLTGRAIGVCFDGAGLGSDGTLWGGEFLLGDYVAASRVAHLRPVRMPGGDAAAREPWRMAVSHLAASGLDPSASPLAARVGAAAVATAVAMIERGFNAPFTSSIGRLFDAVASIAGVCDRMSFEGQAAMRLESLAAGSNVAERYSFGLSRDDAGIDAGPVVAAVHRDAARGIGAHVIARKFHTAIVDMVAAVCGRIRDRTGVDVVVLSGGVFSNAILASEVVARLRGERFDAHRHAALPPNDGGLALGQLAIAAATPPERTERCA
jgi:hydrogenase maturation protein HypF